MSAIDRDALLKWLGEQYYREDISHDRARAFLAVKREIQSGRFDAPGEAGERYRESIEGICRIVQSAESYKTFEDLKSVLISVEWACKEALSTTAEPTGAERVRELWALNTEGNRADEEYLAGIVDTLNAIGITVPGINAPEKEGKTE